MEYLRRLEMSKVVGLLKGEFSLFLVLLKGYQACFYTCRADFFLKASKAETFDLRHLTNLNRLAQVEGKQQSQRLYGPWPAAQADFVDLRTRRRITDPPSPELSPR